MINFVRYALENGGDIQPLIVPAEMMTPGGLFNPSILLDKDGKMIVNIRHCQYTLYHAEKQKYEHHFGPLVYVHPENDVTLTTTNYLGFLNDDLKMTNVLRVDTSKLDVKPIWTFVGLEDVRLTRWDDKLFYTGVRRDTTKNGQGRMELSEIEFTPKYAKEIQRQRIPVLENTNSYCEKNWMPIIDQPYRYVKWCNPTEVVEFDPEKNKLHQVFCSKEKANIQYDFRGGSQVIPFGKHYIALTHITMMHPSITKRKNATYRHAFVIWDKKWNVIKHSKMFSFLDHLIEFACGIAAVGNNIIITFGTQDNSAYVLKIPVEAFTKFVEEVV